MIVHRRRDGGSQYKRVFEFRLAPDSPAEGNIVRVVAATDAEVDMGGYFERLRCSEENVDLRPAKSVLLNHDACALIGGIRNVKCGGNNVSAELEIDPEARLTTGLRALDAVRKGYLYGVSIGYDYSMQNTVRTTNNSGRVHVDVLRWQLLEISLAPTPADLDAHVRSLPAEFQTRKEEPMNREMLLALLRAAVLPESLVEEMAQSAKDVASAEAFIRARKAPPVAPPAHVDEVKAEREKREQVEKENRIRKLAEAHGLKTENLDFAKKCEAELTADLMVRLAEKHKSAPEGSTALTAADVIVTRDGEDKVREAAIDGVMALSPNHRAGKDLGMRCGSIQEIGRRYLRTHAVDPFRFNSQELPQVLLGKGPAMRNCREAVVTSGSFPTYVMVEAFSKIAVGAYRQWMNQVSWPKFAYRRDVKDFKAFKGAGLSVGNLKETVENVPFPELSKGEGGYSGNLAMWGGVISLTLQAMVNDDLGEVLGLLDKAGAIGQRTIEKNLYTDIAGATWTNRTFSSGDLADDTLQKMVQLMLETTGPEGDAEKLLIPMKHLIVPAKLRQTALKLISSSTPNVPPADRYYYDDLNAIITPYLTSATTGAYSTWYGFPPADVQAAVVAFLQGMDVPQVEEFDAGAVAARKYKIYLPFETKVTPAWAYQATHS